ncbi:GAF domain-containing sensor histidine kinase [Calothrix sp. 336/3]|uniref:GAF domain-containing sensor histidine kinase n=1 Tax=Calothrix sp. 336/3 TaxID=1337936 RepID=UPI00069AAC9C|nr:ATP-binding protein [Calothrix sp. 336/3]
MTIFSIYHSWQQQTNRFKSIKAWYKKHQDILHVWVAIALLIFIGYLCYEPANLSVNINIFAYFLLALAVTLLSFSLRNVTQFKLQQTQHRLKSQNQVLLTLARNTTIVEGNLNLALEKITETAAHTLKVERVSIWLYDEECTKIRCLNLFEKSPKRHSQGVEIFASDFPAYFQALKTERTIAADDAYTDPRTSEFGIAYLPAVGVTSMLDAPIWLRGEMIGVVCHEYTDGIRHWNLEEQNFGGCIADLVTLAMEAHQRQQAQQELSRAKEELEIRVQQRTQALDEINQRLLLEIQERSAAQKTQEYLYIQAQTALEIAEARSQELQQALHQLQQTQAQLVQSEKMSSLGQLVAGIAHEINNPINFISGNLDHAENYIQDLVEILRLYEESYSQPSEVIIARSQDIDLDFIIDDLPQLLSSMKAGAQRIRDIVLSLRNFSRLDEAEMKTVCLHEGIDSTLLILQHRLKTGDCDDGVDISNFGNKSQMFASKDCPAIKIIKEYSQLPPVECYPGKLNQVFMNIISNAIDAFHLAKEDEINFQPEIRIRTEFIPPSHVRIRISDNAGGMNEEVKAKIFNPFFTTKPVGDGTGLGLSISYQIIVENHQGNLTCSSQLGKGSEFSLEIPINQTWEKVENQQPTEKYI